MKHSFWGDLKPVQQQDLEALFEKAKQDPSPTQERLLRSQQDARAAASNGGGEGGSSDVPDDHAEEAPEVDAFDLAEPVDVTSKIPKDLHESLASTKWKDRKDGLDALHAAVNVPRIKEADFGELVRSSLAKCMKDANIAVVTVAANCVELLAKGLRGDFAKYRSGIMAPMMERLKEKKQSVADALGAALDAVFASTGLTECLDETLQSLTNKNPQVKQESARFLIRCLRTTRDAPSKAEVKAISEAAIKLLAESTEGLRSSAAEILGTVMKIRGERAMNPYIDGIDDIRKAKVKEYFEKAEVRAKDKPKPVAPAPTAKAGKGPAGKKASDRKPATGLHKAPPAAAAAPAATEDDSAQAPLQARPTARSIPSKAGGSSKASSSIPGAGLRLKKKGAGPDGAAPASAHASPVKAPAARSIPSPVAQEEAPSGPKVGLAGRGLAGRPLGKPNRATPEPAAPAASPGLSVVERAELEELRAENERLRRLTEELRSDKSRLTSQVYELQNQNAELVEDHTRDMLSVKAKETQLVRARSDAEAAQQTCHKQQREMERLKRELSRAMRAASPGPGSGPGQADFGEHIYRDSTTTSTGGANGTGHNHHHHQQQQQQQQPSQHHPHHHALGRPLPRRPPFGSHLSSSEEKENGGPDAFDLRSAKLSPTSLSSAVSSTGTGGGRHSPTFGDGHAAGAGGVGSAGVPLSRTATASSRSTLVGSGGGGNNNNKNSMDNETNAEGIETWKRAAQVTTALKAKIEQMKVGLAFHRALVLSHPVLAQGTRA